MNPFRFLVPAEHGSEPRRKGLAIDLSAVHRVSINEKSIEVWCDEPNLIACLYINSDNERQALFDRFNQQLKLFKEWVPEPTFLLKDGSVVTAQRAVDLLEDERRLHDEYVANSRHVVPPHPKCAASVKVMRSHDYCHFEVALSSSELLDLDQVDQMRKSAARLADKAVKQYQVRKKALALAQTGWFTVPGGVLGGLNREDLFKLAEAAGFKPEGERTPEDKAAIKLVADIRHAEGYDYDDRDDDRDFED